MKSFTIEGGHKLQGTIRISGAKNAALPVLAAALLSDKPLRLYNVPDINDVHLMCKLLYAQGVTGTWDAESKTLVLCAQTLQGILPNASDIRQLRGSILLLGGMLGRLGWASIVMPGGCALGRRGIEFHLAGFKALGAVCRYEGETLHLSTPNGLKGSHFIFPSPTVTGTANLMLAACRAKGESFLENVAQEPEIIDLGVCLSKMGARIEGLGTRTLRIWPFQKIQEISHTIIPDRVETGTYILAAALTDGDLVLHDTHITWLGPLIDPLNMMGVTVDPVGASAIRVRGSQGMLSAYTITTGPFPLFPTDLQAPFMSFLTLRSNYACIREHMYENRLNHAHELIKMGANITLRRNKAYIKGVNKLHGADIIANDLRSGGALVLAALAAQGISRLHNIHHIQRGYANFATQLASCGAIISESV